jgi:hypothetical protein
MKKYLAVLSITAILFGLQETRRIEAKTYFGNGEGEKVSIWGNETVEFDEDNPDAITSMFESKQAKADRELRISVKENIAHLFSEVVPNYETSQWKNKETKVDKNGKYGEASWTPYDSNDQTLEISFEEFSSNSQTKYKNIPELLDFYKKDFASSSRYKISFNILDQTANSALVEIERVERGASDQLKKNTEKRYLERCVVSDGWLIKLTYSLLSAGDPEKSESWNQLKNTWKDRFQNVQFSN